LLARTRRSSLIQFPAAEFAKKQKFTLRKVVEAS